MKEQPISILQDIENDNNLVVGQKLNGHSEKLVIKDGVIRIFNRSGSEQTENIPHITKIKVPKNMDIVLVGEGYAPSGRIEDAKSIFGSHSKHAIEWQKENGLALFTAVNITRANGEDLDHIPFGERLPIITKAVIDLIGCRMPINQEHLTKVGKKAIFDYILSQNGEGVVVKNLKGFEKDWYKVKRIHAWDVVITGFTEANHGKTGKFDGLIGAIQYGTFIDGNLTYAGRCSGMKDEQRVAFSVAQDSYIGRVMEIKGDGLGNRGAVVFPRFVRMRDDKLAVDCILN